MQIRRNYLMTEIIPHSLWGEGLKDECKLQRSLASVEGRDITESPDSHLMPILGYMSQCLWSSLPKQNQSSRMCRGIAEEHTPNHTQNEKEVSLPSFFFLPQAIAHDFALVWWQMYWPFNSHDWRPPKLSQFEYIYPLKYLLKEWIY